MNPVNRTSKSDRLLGGETDVGLAASVLDEREPG
jgi:hypothetical protein